MLSDEQLLVAEKAIIENPNDLKKYPVARCKHCGAQETTLYLCDRGHRRIFCRDCLKLTIKKGGAERFVCKCVEKDCNFLPLNPEGGLTGMNLTEKLPLKSEQRVTDEKTVLAFFLKQKYKGFSDRLYEHLAGRYFKEKAPGMTFDRWAQANYPKVSL